MKGSASYDHSNQDSTSDESILLALVKIKCKQDKEQSVPRPTHLVTNLAYRLKPHHTRNLYLRARLDTCADVSLMPASMYQLVFNDAEMQKLAPSKLQVGTYTTDTVKIVGSCTFYLVHPDTKKLIEVTFYVAINDGSVLLSCKTTLLLGLIQPRPRLDYLLPRASLYHQLCRSLQRKQKQYYIQQQHVVSTQTTKQEVATQTPAAKRQVPKVITSKDMILHEYPDVFEGLASSPGQITIYRWTPAYHPRKHLADQSLYT